MHVNKSQIKLINSLSIKKYRLREKKFVIEGYKLTKEALDNNADFDFLVYSKTILDKPKYKSLLDDITKSKINVFWASDAEIKKISEMEASDGIIGVINIPKCLSSEALGEKVIVALDGVSDPGNMGTIIRTCDWFGVKTVLCSKTCVDIYNPKVLRGTMGSIFHINVQDNVDFETEINTLKGEKYNILGTSINVKDRLGSFELKIGNEKFVLLFGNETHGLSKELEQKCDSLIKIEGFGKAESLNVGVACGVVLYKVLGC